MSRRTLGVLWAITGLVVVILTVATIGLAAESRNRAILSETVYLTGRSTSIQLHAEPYLSSPAVAALARGSAVTVVKSVREGSETWYLVQKAKMTPGWIRSEHIRQNPP